MRFHVIQLEHKHFDDHSDDITNLLNCCNHANSNLRLNKLAVSVTTLIISFCLTLKLKVFQCYILPINDSQPGLLVPLGVCKQLAGGMWNLK
jgi:hypothetical protein